MSRTALAGSLACIVPLRSCFCLCALRDSPRPPPAVTYLYPAGGQRGTTVEVTAGGTFDRWPVRSGTSDRGVTATAGKDKGKLSLPSRPTRCQASTGSACTTTRGPARCGRSSSALLPEVSEKEPNDEPAKAQSVQLPAVVNGRLEKAGDVDVFAVTLKKGETLVASVEANRSLKSPMDGVLQVVSPDGFVLDQNNDWHGLDPQVAFTVPKDGDVPGPPVRVPGRRRMRASALAAARRSSTD